MIDWSAVEDPTERLHAFVSGFHATYYVYTGVSCGLFGSLTEPRSVAALAAERDLHEPYVRAFCEAGFRWGILTVDRTAADDAPVFRLRSEFVEPLATPEAAGFMGGFFKFLGTHQGGEYAAYPTAFETGETRETEAYDAEFTALIQGSTRGLQDTFLDHLLPELSAFEARLDRGGRLVDIGCGTGRLLRRLCARYPDVDGHGIDLDDDAIDEARERAVREDVDDRTTFRVQDATEVDGPVTAAVLFMSLHEVVPERRRALFERLGEVLVDGGAVVVFDEVYPDAPEQFDRLPYAAGVETQWAELPWGADIPTESQHETLLAAAGCERRHYRTVADRFVLYEGVKT